MTKDLDALKAALQLAPTPDQAAKARDIALAMENFDQLQGSPLAARPIAAPPVKAGFVQGVIQMLFKFSARQWLGATTSAAALVLGTVIVLPLANPGGPVADLSPQQAPKTGPEVLAPELAEEQARLAAPAPDPLADEAQTALGRAGSDAAQPEASFGLATTMDAPMAAAPVEQELAATTLPPNTEAFANAPVNPVRITAEEPVSTFSIDVDTASYAVVRSSLNAGQLPPADAVRVEELVNYFPYDNPAPPAGTAFRPSISVMQTPWNPGTRLVHIGIQGALPPTDDRPALNLVFLIDTSGSMEDPNKLPLLKQSFALMLGELRPADQVSIVTYAGSAGQVLPPTSVQNRADILAALDRLAAGGSTAGAEGIELAYRVAEGMKSDGEVSRVILATDGDFNVGISDPEALKTYVAEKRQTGTYLSVLGFGRGNLDDATMQALAQNGNGTAAYIDTLSEARKVLVDQLAGALFPIADNVKIQVEWNPAQVAEYRLIGYETRALAREDFNNDRVDAGDIGAGSTFTAIYEVTAPGSPALANDPLRYQTVPKPNDSPELGFLRIRHIAPGDQESTLQETPILSDAGTTTDAEFAAAIAGFGQLLRADTHLGLWSWDEAITLALSARGDDPFGYRIEAVNLMRLAQSLQPK